jgi:DNA-binding transcriptional ArsR family regulator
LCKYLLIYMSAEPRRDVFQAIADPTRREIIELLADQPMNLKTIAEHFDISRPAISQQVKILHECGLIGITREGRETFCTINAQELKKISVWISRYKGLWEEKIDAFENYVNKLQAEKNKKHGKSK